jgi:alpha-D-xyloside xylohydrolase
MVTSKKSLLLFALCSLISFLNSSFAAESINVSLNQLSDNGFAFKISSPYLAQPVFIVPDQNGLVFIKTAAGKQYLKKPNDTKTSDGKSIYTWKLNDGRIVAIEFVPNKSNLTIRFTAKPDNDILEWGFAIRASKDEYFTGIFERTVDGNQKLSWQKGIRETLNLRGQEIDMRVKPTVSLYCPFYISSKNYSLFVEGTWPGHYDFCKSDPNLVKISFEGPSLVAILNTAKNPVDLVKAHSLYVGPTILPPKWAFGVWRWRDNNANNKNYYDGTAVCAPYNSTLVEDILMMQAFDIPCSVYWVDRPWCPGHLGYDDFIWDPNRLPMAKEMIKWLNSKKIRFLLWIAPWVNGNMANQALQNNYCFKGPIQQDAEQSPHIDFTNPDAKKWWQQGLKKVLDDGVAGFKLDRSEEGIPDSLDLKVFDGRTNREHRNAYPLEYLKATWEITHKTRGDDFVLMPRAGYTNSSRFGVFWGGDIGSPPEGLRAAIIALQRSAIIGYPIWGSDTGGYWQGDLDREVLARWLAFSCFCPLMEVGPTEDRGLWDMKKEPHYDAELIAIWRLYAKIHDKLIDYSYKAAKIAQETGLPIARPLFLIYPQQKECWTQWQSYLYGPDIFVYPIWQKDSSQRTMYLPAGEQWIDAWDKTKVYNGGQTITISTPLHKIPIFIRKGSSVDLGDLNRLYEESLRIASQKPDLDKLQKNEFLKK